MRIIDLTGNKVVELWPGRRLFAEGELAALPKGHMSATYGKNVGSLTFGSPTKTSVIVNGTVHTITSLFNAIVEMERPETAKVIR